MEPSSFLFTDTTDPFNYVGVPSGTFAISNANHPYLFTCEVTSNFVITFFDSKQKIGALLHLNKINDRKETLKNISAIFTNLQCELNHLQIKVFGGYQGNESEDEYDEIKSNLSKISEDIKERIYEKKSPTQKTYIFLQILQQILVYEKDQKQLLDKILEKHVFTQICLNVITGEVLSSSSYVHFISETSEAYTPEALEAFKSNLSIAQCFSTLDGKQKKELSQKFCKAAVKVFDYR